jgi:26S proteasome regulatory subunit N11
MDPEIERMMAQAQARGGGPQNRPDIGTPDKWAQSWFSRIFLILLYSGEVIHISSLALLKVSLIICAVRLVAYARYFAFQMLKHGRAGVPMEVMGLMLGEFVDEYTVQVIDVFAMPQSGTTVTVESVDHVFQTKMVDMLKQTGR